MDRLEKENQPMVTTLRDSLERISTMMETLAATQNQPPPHSPQTLLQRTMISKITYVPICVAPFSAP